jgi:hypothetical protein
MLEEADFLQVRVLDKTEETYNMELSLALHQNRSPFRPVTRVLPLILQLDQGILGWHGCHLEGDGASGLH